MMHLKLFDFLILEKNVSIFQEHSKKVKFRYIFEQFRKS